MTARRVTLVIGIAALMASGVYVFVYLNRWEWHRALVAGIIFLAAEVGVGLTALFDRLRRIETRLDQAASADDMQRVLSHIEDAAPPAGPPFQWLTSDSDRFSVFVPILLGAGVVLSGVAWAVERVARASAGPVLERNLALRLAPLSFPEGALTGAPPPSVSPVAVRAPVFRTRVVAAMVAVTVGGAIAMAADALGDITQDRPDAPAPAGAVSIVTLTVGSKAHYDDGGTLAVANTVWSACTSQLRRHGVPEMTPIGGAQVQATVSPALGPYAQERLRGCLNDATVDRLSLTVAGIQNLEP